MYLEDRRSFAVGVVGVGRLGSALAAALAAGGYGVTVASRREERAQALGAALGVEAASMERLVERCEVVFLAVPDGVISAVAEALAWRRGQAAVHCSGALGLQVLDAARMRGAAVGCLHPLQTFPAGVAPDEAARLFRGIVCGVEAREPLSGRLEALVRNLGARTVRLEEVDRALYHAAAVLVSNDVVALASAAARAWALAGLPEGEAREALAPLLLAAAQNVATLPLHQALTGPVARGDVATVERHLRALRAAPELEELYRLLALELLRLDLVHAPEVTASLRALLERE